MYRDRDTGLCRDVGECKDVLGCRLGMYRGVSEYVGTYWAECFGFRVICSSGFSIYGFRTQSLGSFLA